MLALLMAAVLAAGSPAALESARDRQDRAALQKMAQDFSAAAAKANNDAAAQHTAAIAWSYLAEVAQQQHDKKQARQAAEQGIKNAERAVALKPEAENYRVLGILYGQAVTDVLSGLSYAPKAKDAINKAVQKAPGSSSVYVARGVGNYYLPSQFGGGAKAAIPDFRKAIQLDPRNADAYLWLGISLAKENMHAEARQALSKSLQLAPNRLWAKQQQDKLPAK
jgi:tetratricopeptide (TPR) repeat protein